MATGTATAAPVHTALRRSAAGGDVDQRIEAIGREAEAEPQSVVGMPTGGQIPADPFATLQGVAGWAVDYVAFLREPIDQLQGDPQSVRATAEMIRSSAERMRELAERQRETLAKPQGWTGKAQEAYQDSMEALGEELGSLAAAVAKKGVVVEHTGGMVQALREALLYTVGQYSDSLVPGAISAYVLAPATFGASIAVFLGGVVSSATQLGTSIAAKMDDLNAALTRQVDRVKQLDTISDEVGQRWERFEAAAGGGTATARTAASRMLLRGEAVQGEPAVQALRPMESLRSAEAIRPMESLRPMESGHLVAAERSEALRPMQSARLLSAEESVALRPMESARLLPAEESMQVRHAVRQADAEPMQAQARYAVQAEPMQAQARYAVQAEPMQAVRMEAPVQHEQLQPMARAAEAVTHYRTAEPVEARGVTATHQAAVRRVEETE
ncbi:WXG100 family type VII secretion target [Saccharothrix longispora]|uniref:Uncharacterized protein YukE n=1 Tax=Saccharothrix longispora TaxID=33920 RepID=A0ABU1PPW6_9PSEU|nr:hypothetical protein [Saccharothrix longispora]MDR6592703.1 uncharacterized protein YukE [Saccharothrix longispora]